MRFVAAQFIVRLLLKQSLLVIGSGDQEKVSIAQEFLWELCRTPYPDVWSVNSLDLLH